MTKALIISRKECVAVPLNKLRAFLNNFLQDDADSLFDFAKQKSQEMKSYQLYD